MDEVMKMAKDAWSSISSLEFFDSFGDVASSLC